MAQIRLAQYGVKHGHAAGKARAMQTNSDVELVGIYEPDQALWPRLQESPAYAGMRWLRSADELLGDPSIVAVAIEGANHESLAMAREAMAAGKHLWLDKPAGDDWDDFQQLIAEAQARQRQVQMGYMFRYAHGFRQIDRWVKDGLLGEVFGLRAHMSTWLPVSSAGSTATARADIASHHGGGIFYDLGGHMLDQVIWLLGRPERVTSFLRNDQTPETPAFADNTLAVFEFARAMATVDIAAMESRPTARRFEVYGTHGSAILEPFEPAAQLRLCLEAASGSYSAGAQAVPVPVQTRQEMYELELAAFVETLRGQRPPDRPLFHELLVQETLLRATGSLASG